MRNKAAVNELPDSKVQAGSVPRHVAIIMDGNNRWAKQHGLPSAAGHKAGLDSVRTIMRVAAEQGVEVVTLFAFSSENWRRPETEVSALMNLFLTALRREVKKIHKNNIRLKVIGNRSRFSQSIQEGIQQAEQLTADNAGCTVVIAADYGGQWDIVQDSQTLASKVAAGELTAYEITPEVFQSQVCLGDMPMPDLCIRTAGECRISNFLLWQMAYTEFYFTDVYWPDFGEQAFMEALADFQCRERRFGHTSNASSDTNKNSEEAGA